MIIKKFFHFAKENIAKIIAKYFNSKTATFRSIAAIFGCASLVYLFFLWIVSMGYAVMHNGQFPKMNDFYFGYIPIIVLLISWVTYYPTDFAIWEKEVSK